MDLRSLSVLGIVLAALLACNETEYVDVSAQPGYRDIVGATYTIKSPVSAYGIRKHSKAVIEYVSVMPPPGIDGSEIGFRIPITVGSTLTVMSIHKTNRIFDPSISLEVKLTGVVIPANLPIRVDLMRGNQGTDELSLNPAVFQRR